MTTEELILLARQTAIKHNVPPEIVLGMIDREATENQWAVRYEPGFLARYVMPQYKAGKLDITETYTRAMSWGVMQIMGETAREFGFEGKYLSQLCDPVFGIEYGCRKLAACVKSHPDNIEAALEAYNGGANPSYGKEVLALSAKYVTETRA